MSRDIAFMPPPRNMLIRKRVATSVSTGRDGADSQVVILSRRLESVLVGTAASTVLAAIAFYRHPLPDFLVWVICEILLSSVRIAVVISILRRTTRRSEASIFGTWDADLFIITGILWSSLQGLGNVLVMPLDDPGLVLLVCFMSLVTIAAQSIRNPSSCRMNNVQMSVVLIPFSIAVLSSPIPLLRWDVVFGPIFLLTMINLTGQIHQDYLAMIMAQIENSRDALHCALTGLPNRRSFDERLREALARTANDRRTLSVLCIDLDGFKAINDRFGHPVGDALLVQVAERLSGVTRASDVAARLGGDEFAVLMPSSDHAAAETLATRINGLMAEPFILGSNIAVTIGASVGIWSFDRHADAVSIDARTIMMQADQALYAAKHAGKGTFRRSTDRDFELATISQPAGMPDMRLAG